jgi:hypothetical protein
MALTKIISELIGDNAIVYTKLGVEFTTQAALAGTVLDFSLNSAFTATNSGVVTYTITNANVSMVKDFYLNGTGSFIITGGLLISGGFVESVDNFIQIVAKSSSVFHYSISQEII